MTKRKKYLFKSKELFDQEVEIEILETINKNLSITLTSGLNKTYGFLLIDEYRYLKLNNFKIRYIERFTSLGKIPKTKRKTENIYSKKNLVLEKTIKKHLIPFLNSKNPYFELHLFLESCDGKIPSDILTMTTAMILAFLSGLITEPYYIGRICYKDKYINSPTFEEISKSDFSFEFTCNNEKIYYLKLIRH